MQTIDMNWTTFGISLAVGIVLGCLYAGLVRWAARKGFEGQTAWSVVVGVFITLVLMIPTFGLFLVALVFCFFAATGIPMVVEYLSRVQRDHQRDQEQANHIAKDLLK